MKIIHINITILCLLLNVQILISQTYSWHTLANAPASNGRFEDIFFINTNTGWVVGSNFGGKIYRTTDGGSSWILCDTINGDGLPRCVTFINENTGWIGTIGTVGRRLIKTTDGGLTWSEVVLPSPQPSGICGLFALNENFIFGSGAYYGDPVFLKSTNGGVTWTTKDMSAYATGLVDNYFFSPDSGIVVGGLDTFVTIQRSIILFTSDGGQTWQYKYKGPRLSEQGWKISFPDRNHGFVSFEKGQAFNIQYFAKTADGGQTWTDLPFVSNARQQGIGFVNENKGWIGGGNQSYETSNGGINWTFNPDAGVRVNRFRFFGDTVGYAIGATVYKYSQTVSIHNISSIATDYSLNQNFPNPFNPVTKIVFSIPKVQFVSLKIFNSTGGEVETIVSQVLKEGVYEINWNAQQLPSGIYFYTLYSEHNYQSRKMILLK